MGCQPLIHKHIKRGLTYDLLIVIYHLLKILACLFYQNISHIHFNFHLKEQLLNRLSLNCFLTLSKPLLSLYKRNLYSTTSKNMNINCLALLSTMHPPEKNSFKHGFNPIRAGGGGHIWPPLVFFHPHFSCVRAKDLKFYDF